MDPSPRSTHWMKVRGVYLTKSDLLPDIWLVVPLSRIIFSDFDTVGEHWIGFIRRATILARDERLR